MRVFHLMSICNQYTTITSVPHEKMTE